MSRSQPKPKIIYRTLQNIIKESNFSSQKQCIELLPNNKSLPLRSTTEGREGSHSIKRTSSRHSLQNKWKICTQQNKKQQDRRTAHSKKYEEHLDEINHIYQQMQQFLNESKETVIAQIIEQIAKKGQNQPVVHKKIKELQKMSDYLKSIIYFFAGNKIAMPLKPQIVLPMKNEKQNQSIDKLSIMNQKKRANGRCNKAIAGNRISIYENVLSKML